MTINFGIIGCGYISKKFADALKQVDNAKLLSVAASKKRRLKILPMIFVRQMRMKAMTN